MKMLNNYSADKKLYLVADNNANHLDKQLKLSMTDINQQPFNVNERLAADIKPVI